jgi:hypothetical protein
MLGRLKPDEGVDEKEKNLKELFEKNSDIDKDELENKLRGFEEKLNRFEENVHERFDREMDKTREGSVFTTDGSPRFSREELINEDKLQNMRRVLFDVVKPTVRDSNALKLKIESALGELKRTAEERHKRGTKVAKNMEPGKRKEDLPKLSTLEVCQILESKLSKGLPRDDQEKLRPMYIKMILGKEEGEKYLAEEKAKLAESKKPSEAHA